MKTLVLLIAAGFALAAGPLDAQVVKIWPGVAPGSEGWTQKERTVKNTPLGAVVFDVVTPTLALYRPASAKATGTGVIIAPVAPSWHSPWIWRELQLPAGCSRGASLPSCSSTGSSRRSRKEFRRWTW